MLQLTPVALPSGGEQTLARPSMRSTSNVATRLARSVGVISATSANLHGEEPAHSAEEVARRFPALALVLDGGPTIGADPSTIVDVTRTPPRIVREGSVARTALAKVIPGIQ